VPRRSGRPGRSAKARLSGELDLAVGRELAACIACAGTGGGAYHLRPVCSGGSLGKICFNWLRVSGTTKMSQVDKRVRHQLHAVVPPLDELEP
jgi:hypothetical protein